MRVLRVHYFIHHKAYLVLDKCYSFKKFQFEKQKVPHTFKQMAFQGSILNSLTCTKRVV